MAAVLSGDEGAEPDYRFTLANERTFLAWVRTALALDAVGVAVLHLLPELMLPGGREAAGVALVVLGAVVVVFANVRWRRFQEAMRKRRPLPTGALPTVVTVVLVAASSVVAALLAVESVRGP